MSRAVSRAYVLHPESASPAYKRKSTFSKEVPCRARARRSASTKILALAAKQLRKLVAPKTVARASPRKKGKAAAPEDLDQWDDFGGTLLMRSVRNKDMDTVKQLISKNVVVDRVAKNNTGNTALIIAVVHGLLDFVVTLLEAGADATKTSASEGAPIHYACNRGHHEIVDVLLKYGADSRARYPKKSDQGVMYVTAWHLAASSGSDRVLALLLRKEKCAAAALGDMITFGDASDQRHGRTVLGVAIENCYTECVREILAFPREGAAAAEESKQIANGSRLANMKCDNANTLPLFLAMEVRSGRITKMLLEAGADRSAHNADGIAAKDFVRNVSSEAVKQAFTSVPPNDCSEIAAYREQCLPGEGQTLAHDSEPLEGLKNAPHDREHLPTAGKSTFKHARIPSDPRCLRC
eukprot:INCI4142.2.p1 GENE.INCI4142.2~~INCI4142.2.p1  ORF type:complete len:410 (-),score=52.12 INCI4142.2:402-1631(-)